MGFGDLGYGMLRSLLRRSGIERMVAADRDVELGEFQVSTALLSPVQDGCVRILTEAYGCSD